MFLYVIFKSHSLTHSRYAAGQQQWYPTSVCYKTKIDCKAGTTAEGQNLLATISTSRASLHQGQYLVQEK